MRRPRSHGTPSGYRSHRNRGETPCEPCREANRAYYREYRALTKRSVPAERVARHIRRLRKAGVGMTTLAAVAGTTQQTVYEIVNGRRKWVTLRVARAILAVTADAAFSVPALGTTRRIHALAALGWTYKRIGATAGLSPQRVGQIVAQDRVVPATAAAIAAAYDELSMRLGPSDHARRRARGAGHLPPLAWDDERIDDPTYQPGQPDEADGIDEIAVQRAMAGDPPERMTRAERAEASRRLTAAGYSAAQIAARLRVNPKSVERYRAAS